MKLKNILYRKFNDLSNNEKEFYTNNRDKYELNLCDKHNTVCLSQELVWIDENFQSLSNKGLKEVEDRNYVAVSEEVFNELCI